MLDTPSVKVCSSCHEIRKWIIENDWLEGIVSLPTKLFFNTGIQTYLWIVTNKKKNNRKGKIQLIDGQSKFVIMKKKLGEKRKKVSEINRKDILDLYRNFQENQFSKIYENEFFGYTRVTIEQPLIENGKGVTTKNGKLKPNTKLRDTERIPLSENIDEYYNREVKTHLPDSWMDREKDKVGYEINFTKYFYQYKPLRNLKEITSDLLELEKESIGLFNEVTGI